MEPTKYTTQDAREINQDTKVIYKYPTPTKDFDIARMVVKGRHPKDPQAFIIEKECSFVIYILRGKGKVYAGNETFELVAQDVMMVPNNTLFAVEGDMEYITFDSPAFYPEQSIGVHNV